MTEEGKIQKKILDYLNGLDCCKAVKVMEANEAGTPDIACCWRGRMVMLEVKQGQEHAIRSCERQPIQVVRICEWQDAGAIAATVWSVNQVESIIGSIRL